MTRFKPLSFTACATICLLAPLEVVLLLLTGLAGCANQQQFKALEQICVPDTGKTEAMQIAEDVLGQMHFAIDKADADQGLIRTRPLPGAQFFELWRIDNVGAFNSAEANLHSIRRIVELDISQQGEKLCVGCNVNVQRMFLPEQQVTSTARAYELFSRSTQAIQTLKLHPEQKKGVAWVDLGKDTKLATKILKRIEKQITSDGTRATGHEL